ncbi:hypothetical protein BJY52DRAFT_1192105 [Lactarius psammicola]|nr:hypothetical protein BJY52DRAFT_1192105 [Lactarius psammicola]
MEQHNDFTTALKVHLDGKADLWPSQSTVYTTGSLDSAMLTIDTSNLIHAANIPIPPTPADRQTTPTVWEPTPPPPILPPTHQEGMGSVAPDALNCDTAMNSPDSDVQLVGITVGNNQDVPTSQQSLHEALVKAAEGMVRGRPPVRLPATTRALIADAAKRPSGAEPAVSAQPIRSVSRAQAHMRLRDASRASAWSDASFESFDNDDLEFFREAVPIPTDIPQFFEDLEAAFHAPYLLEAVDISGIEVDGVAGTDRHGVCYTDDNRNDLVALTEDLRQELGREISSAASGYAEFYLHDMIKLHKNSNIPASVQDFNDSVGMVIAALDAGVDADLPIKGLLPSSWFRLAAGLLSAMLRGVLRSRDQKSKGRVDCDPIDHFHISQDLDKPETEGGRIAVMARQLSDTFDLYSRKDQPESVEYLQRIQKITQRYTRRAVTKAAAQSYQVSVEDAVTMKNIALEDRASRVLQDLANDPDTKAIVEREVRRRMMKKLEDECMEDIDEWRTVYRKGLAAALRAEATGTEIPVLSHSQIVRECSGEIQAQVDKKVEEIRLSIIQEEVEKHLLLSETDNAKASIRRKYYANIETARQEARAEVSSEKKAWAVAYRDSNHLEFLSAKAKDLGYMLVRLDADEEREGRSAKRGALEGKRSCSASRAEDVTPCSVPVTPVTRPRKLDGSITPTPVKKKKGKGRALVIPKPLPNRSGVQAVAGEDSMDEDAPLPPPLFLASSSAPSTPKTAVPILPISVPTNVRASQQPDGPVRDPVLVPLPPTIPPTPIVAVVDLPTAIQGSARVVPNSESSQDSQDGVLPLMDSPLRGVSSSMHNPKNQMEVDAGAQPPLAPSHTPIDTPTPDAPVKTSLPTVGVSALPSIPLMPGLAELLSALQTNITNAFTSQIASITQRLDQHDSQIKDIVSTSTPSVPPRTNPISATAPLSVSGAVNQGKGKGKAMVTAGPVAAKPPTFPGVPAPAASAKDAGLPSTSPVSSAPTKAAPKPPAAAAASSAPAGPLSRAPLGPVPVPREATRWASVITNSNFAGQHAARQSAKESAASIGRGVSGAKKAGGSPSYLQNTEITVIRGKGMKDEKAETNIRRLSPSQIVQSVRGNMEKLTATPPALMCGRWSTKEGSCNFVYVFAGNVPFSTISQYRKVLVEPLGCGDILPNRGWTFAQLRGVPTSDGGGVIFSPQQLLDEIRIMPFFADAIFCSMPHWQASVHTISTVSTSTVQIAFIDEDGSRSQAAKHHGVGMFGLRVGYFSMGNTPFFSQCGRCHAIGHVTGAPACRLAPNSVKCHICGGAHLGTEHNFHCKATTHVVAGQCNCRFKCLLCGQAGHNARSPKCPKRGGGFKPCPISGPIQSPQSLSSSGAISGGPSSSSPSARVDSDGFTAVGKNVGKPTKSRKRKPAAARRAAKAVAAAVSHGGEGAVSDSLEEVIFPEDVATLGATMDAFRNLAVGTSDGSIDDLSTALHDLEKEWESNTPELDGLTSLEARYAVKHRLPLCVPHVKDAIARKVMCDTRNGIKEVHAELAAYEKTHHTFSPKRFVLNSLGPKTRFATPDEVKVRVDCEKKRDAQIAEVHSCIDFVLNITNSMFENNELPRRISMREADFLVNMNDLAPKFAQTPSGDASDLASGNIGPLVASLARDLCSNPLAAAAIFAINHSDRYL